MRSYSDYDPPRFLINAMPRIATRILSRIASPTFSDGLNRTQGYCLGRRLPRWFDWPVGPRGFTPSCPWPRNYCVTVSPRHTKNRNRHATHSYRWRELCTDSISANAENSFTRHLRSANTPATISTIAGGVSPPSPRISVEGPRRTMNERKTFYVLPNV